MHCALCTPTFGSLCLRYKDIVWSQLLQGRTFTSAFLENFQKVLHREGGKKGFRYSKICSLRNLLTFFSLRAPFFLRVHSFPNEPDVEVRL